MAPIPSRSCWATATEHSNLPSATTCRNRRTWRWPTSIATANSIWRSGPIFSTVVMLGNGDRTFKASIAAASQGGAQAVADFNGDGIPDLAIVLFTGFGVAAGDLNGDGQLHVPSSSGDGISAMPGWPK